MAEDDIWHLQRLNFFPELTPEQKAFVESAAQTLKYKKNDPIYFPGQLANYVYVVQAGHVRLARQTPKGSFLTLDILNPGDIFGEMALAGQDRQSDTAEALRDCAIWAIPRDALIAVVTTNPGMMLQITKIIGFRRWQIENTVSSLLCTVPVRLARLILTLADRYPAKVPAPERRAVNIRLTHQDLGELIGANREIVTATLNRFKQTGLIDIARNQIILQNERALSDTAQRDKG